LTLSEGDTILVGVSKGFITLPEDPKTPIICVGPGTGVAPMRAIIQHRLGLGAKGGVLRYILVLFLGFLNPCFEKKKTTHCILVAGQQPKTNTTPPIGKTSSNPVTSSTDSLRLVMAQREYEGPMCNISLNKMRGIFGM
jgi:hypothetical protein